MIYYVHVHTPEEETEAKLDLEQLSHWFFCPVRQASAFNTRHVSQSQTVTQEDTHFILFLTGLC